MEIATDRILSAVTEPAGGGPQPPFMKGEVPMHLKSTDHRPGNRSRHKCSPPPPPPIFSGPRRRRGDDRRADGRCSGRVQYITKERDPRRPELPHKHKEQP